MASKPKTDKRRKAKRVITFKGETKGIAQWARELKIRSGTIIQRLKAGMPVELVLSTERVERRDLERRGRLLTFRGETKSQSEWSKELGISQCTISYRLRRGWPVEKALSFAPHQRTTNDDPMRFIRKIKKPFEVRIKTGSGYVIKCFETLEEAQEFRDNYLSSN